MNVAKEGWGGTPEPPPCPFADQPAKRLLCGFPFRPQLLKNALQRAVEKGQLEQITGKGASGTFQVGKGGSPGNWGWAGRLSLSFPPSRPRRPFLLLVLTS